MAEPPCRRIADLTRPVVIAYTSGVSHAARLRHFVAGWSAVIAVLSTACAPDPAGAPADDGAPLLWRFDRLDSLGGHPLQLLGAPRLVETALGPALEFDGEEDGLRVGLHPLEGAREFTIEVIFRPAPGGDPEQRFLHLQEHGSKDRILLETRLVAGDRWFLDTYVKSGGEGYTLFADKHLHPLGRWHHAALVVADREMRHYVDGVLELARPIDFAPQGPGRSSIGVRINEVSWFKGAIREARFTPRALGPEEFLELPAP